MKITNIIPIQMVFACMQKRAFTIFIYCTAIFLLSCSGGVGPETSTTTNYRQDMRHFVQQISDYAKEANPKFIIIPQNGPELLTGNGTEAGSPVMSYLNAIDGVGKEDLFYGYNNDNEATPESERNYMTAYMDMCERNGIEVLVTDYCRVRSFVDDSYERNAARGYISFAADHRELDNIPDYPVTPYNVNDCDIASLSEAKNFLYLLNPVNYGTKEAFLKTIQDTNYDIVIIDLFYEYNEELNASEIARVKTKANGGSRLAIAYMSIGEAENYRYYWEEIWEPYNPSWLGKENPDWPGNYKVDYWDENWHGIIYGKEDSYMKKIVDAGFDGVYLDIIDAFEYFENG